MKQEFTLRTLGVAIGLALAAPALFAQTPAAPLADARPAPERPPLGAEWSSLTCGSAPAPGARP